MQVSTTFISGQMGRVSVLIEGRPALMHPWGQVAFIAGEPGVPYSIKIENTSGRRIECVLGVDGRHVLRDEAANPDRVRGLVIAPSKTWNCQGFQLNGEEAGQIAFGNPAESVAARATGSTDSVGAIGIAIFEESSSPFTLYDGGGDDPFGDIYRGGGSHSTYDGGDLGTIMTGDVLASRMGQTRFERVWPHGPADIFNIQYRSAEWLRKHGILLPNPFPGYRPGDTGYGAYLPTPE